MKNFKALATLFLGLILIYSCSNSSNKKVEVAETINKECCDTAANSCCENGEVKADSIIRVVYFHNERRCATCMAVEDVSKEFIAKFDSTKIKFSSYQIGEEACANLEKELEITGQALLIIEKGKVTDLTNSAFMNARVNPSKFKEDLKKAIKL